MDSGTINGGRSFALQNARLIPETADDESKDINTPAIGQ